MSSRFAVILLGLMVGAAASAAEHNAAPRHNGAAATARVHRVIVQFREQAPTSQSKTQSAQARVKALANRSGLDLQSLRQIGPGQHVLRVSRADGADIEGVLARLRADESVEFADPDRRRHAHAVPSDPLYVDQWYWKAAEVSASRFEGAWDATTGAAGMVIAVIDSGVRFEHPDLGRVEDGGKLLPGYDFISAEEPNEFRVANDGDGWDPDPSDPGDWVGEPGAEDPWFEEEGCEPTADGSSWHGTRVSGVIGARTNNAEGIAGGTWAPLILPVRVLGKCGGFDSDILAGMRWAAGLDVRNDEDPVPTNPNPARVINMSLGATGECPAAYRDLMEELEALGVLVVVSAGNEVGVPVDSPANCPLALGVAGLRHIGTKVGFSNIGREIGISAPGGNCVNDYPPGPCLFSIDTTTNLGATTPAGSGYTDKVAHISTGTSFSSPIVAAAAALVRTVNPRLTPTQAIIRLQQGARPFPQVDGIPNCQVPTASSAEQDECNCTTSTCGAGMLDATGALAEAVKPFVIVEASDSTPGEGATVTLDGSESFAKTGSAIASYEWTVVSAAGEEPELTNADQAEASFVAPLGGAITLRLTVTDDEGAVDSADVTVTTPTTTTPSSNGGGGGGGSVDAATLAVAGFLALLSFGIRACAAARRRACPARRASRG